MLARTPLFLSARDLGITEQEWSALINVRERLLRGEFLYWPKSRFDQPSGYSSVFNMAVFDEEYDCGTVRCIGGTCDAEYDTDFVRKGIIGELPEGLEGLFFPEGNDDLVYSYDSITPARAAHAIGNYLTIGEARWEDVL